MNSVFVDAHSIVDYFSDQLEKPVENYAGYMSTKALDDFSLQLVNYRIEHHLNQTELARELGITQPMVSQYESGTNNITVKRLCEICEKIGVRVRLDYEDAGTSELSKTYFDPEANCSVTVEHGSGKASSFVSFSGPGTDRKESPVLTQDTINLPESA